jgi:hypothetical protein
MATFTIAAALGTGAAAGVAACGEDRSGEVKFDDGSGTESTGTGTESTGTGTESTTAPASTEPKTTPTETTP